MAKENLLSHLVVKLLWGSHFCHHKITRWSDVKTPNADDGIHEQAPGLHPLERPKLLESWNAPMEKSDANLIQNFVIFETHKWC